MELIKKQGVRIVRFYGKFAVLSCCFRFEIRPLALLPTKCKTILVSVSANKYTVTFFMFHVIQF